MRFSFPPPPQTSGRGDNRLTHEARCSANEHTVAAGKKTVLPADVFKALDDTEFSFLREPLEAEFASRWRSRRRASSPTDVSR